MANYKGMDANMQCRGFQYEVGKTYKTDVAELCKSGFHACEFPLDVFVFYPPAQNRFFEVEQGGKITSGGVKTCSTEITIKSEIGLDRIAAAAVEYIKQRCADPISAGDHGVSTAGNHGVSTAGYGGVSTAGYCGVSASRGSAAAGRQGCAIARGKAPVVSGGRGALICCATENDNRTIKFWRADVVDGEHLKADTPYTLNEKGEWEEAKNG